MSKETGYEILDAEAVCKEEYKIKEDREMRVNGMGHMKKDEIEGFIERNNVMDRL